MARVWSLRVLNAPHFWLLVCEVQGEAGQVRTGGSVGSIQPRPGKHVLVPTCLDLVLRYVTHDQPLSSVSLTFDDRHSAW